jgi:hypothetical protein
LEGEEGPLRPDLSRKLPVLADLALDLRWTWSHAGDALWRMIDPEAWDKTRNPWMMLQDVSRHRLGQLARDARFQEELRQLVAAREAHLSTPTWYDETHAGADFERVAYFSLEFGLGESLPLYAGGLGILETISRPRVTSAYRRWAWGCSTRSGTSARGWIPTVGSTRYIPITIPRACRASSRGRMAPRLA